MKHSNANLWAGVAIGYFVNLGPQLVRDKMQISVRDTCDNLLQIVSTALGTSKRLELTACCFEDLATLESHGEVEVTGSYAAVFIGFLSQYCTRSGAKFTEYRVTYTRSSAVFTVDTLGPYRSL